MPLAPQSPRRRGRPGRQAAAPPALPTAVSAGYESMPGQHAPGDDSHNGFVVAALAIMAVAGTALVVVRRLYV